MEIHIENLKAKMRGVELSSYQKGLALDEFEKLTAHTEALEQKLRQYNVSGSLLSEIRQAVAAYMWSEGCSCCRSDNHDENGERLAVLLGVKKHEDGSGYDWESVRKQ